MRPEDFRFRLVGASYASANFGKTMVDCDVPFDFRYCVILNSSYDGNREEDEVVFPEDAEVIHWDLSSKEVVELLCRDGKVPQWIDISLVYCENQHSHLELSCCGRFHSDDSRLYYYGQGTQPFGIKSPVLPLRFQEGQRFALPTLAEYRKRVRRFKELAAQEREDE